MAKNSPHKQRKFLTLVLISIKFTKLNLSINCIEEYIFFSFCVYAIYKFYSNPTMSNNV